MRPLLRKLFRLGFVSGSRMTPRARSVLSLAKRQIGESRFRPSDILLRQILELHDCTALKILKRLGYTPHMLIAHVELNLQCQVKVPPPRQTLGYIVEFALCEAKSLNHGYLGTEHLLLGILCDEEESHNADKYGISLTKVREEVVREFSAP